MLGLFFLPPPTSLEHEFYGVTGGFTRFIMKTKYVFHNVISPYVNFHNNRTVNIIFLSKFLQVGGGGRKKSPCLLLFHWSTCHIKKIIGSFSYPAPPPPTCKIFRVIFLFKLSDCYKIWHTD